MKTAVFFIGLLGLPMFSSAVEVKAQSCDYSVRDSVAVFAQEQLGVPYIYGGASQDGFDCSGFVMFVYEKFGIQLPHSSKLMAKLGHERSRKEAKTGDLILFRGKNTSTVGHVGIVYNNMLNDELIFIHSSSPRSGGVIFSSLDQSYYKTRFVKIVDVLL